MNEHPLTHILNQLAAEGAPADLDLRLAVHQRLETSKTHSPKGVFSMKTSFAHPRRLAATIVLVILLLAAAFLLTPQGRAWAKSTFKYFTRAYGDTLSMPTQKPAQMVDATTQAPQPTITPWPDMAFTAECGYLASPSCTLSEIQGKVSFEVKALAEIPSGLRFIGATGGPDSVLLIYQEPVTHWEIMVQQGPSEALSSKAEVGASATIETVQVGNSRGEYVKGGWFSNGQTATWDPSFDGQTLFWQEGDISYALAVFGVPPAPAKPLDKDDLVSLAQNLTSTPDPSLYSKPVRYGSLDEVKAVAGFDVIEPWVPQSFTLQYASYEPRTKSVCLYYHVPLKEPGMQEGLAVIESLTAPFSKIEEVQLPASAFGPNPQVDLSQTYAVVTETLAVGGAVNGQGLYESTLMYVDEYCGDNGAFHPNHALVVQTDGMWFAIFSACDGVLCGNGGNFLTRFEARKMAESITGVHTIPEDQPDPLRLPSVEVAEQLAGFDIKLPTKLPESSVFDHASYEQDGQDQSISVDYITFTLSARTKPVYHSSNVEPIDRPANEEPEGWHKNWVNGQPAYYKQKCAGSNGGDLLCGPSVLTWLEDGLEYELLGYLKEADLVAIAESMK